MTGLGFQREGGGSSEGYMGHGIFLDEVEIVKVVDISGKVTERQTEPRDLSLEVHCKILKNGWDRTITIAGNFQRDKQTGAIEGWGAAFKVRNFLLDVGVAGEDMELEEDNKIPLHLIAKVAGKHCLILSYRNNRGKSSSWNQMAAVDADKEAFVKYFLDQHSKSGWPRNYDPAGKADTSGPWNEGKQAEYGVNSVPLMSRYGK